MPSSLFISYSRRELPFVDSLLDVLEDRGFKVWLDYHSLVPARPWLEQIQQGIAEAEIFLLIVSKASMSSKNVTPEWQRAIELKKRIILIIFEAVKLPPELTQYEWIDFRSSFKQGLKILLDQLTTPIKPPSPPPQRGFKAPPVVWASFLVSLLVIIVSIPAWWTIYLPAVLLPLPYKILKRNFNFFQVQSAIIMLPFVAFLSAVFFGTYQEETDLILSCFGFSLVAVPILFFLLRSAGMRRWGKPMASRPKFANPYEPNIKKPAPTSFTIDFAPEDQNYAEAISRGLQKYGHPYVTEANQAETAFVLISAYKNSTTLNPEARTVYPIILQDIPLQDRNLQRLQWIDFRRGLRHLDKLAQLLPEPTKLLKALGIVPMSNQTVLPPIIQALVYYLTLLAIFSISTWLPLFVELGEEFFQMESSLAISGVNILLTGAILAIIFMARRALLNRRGRLASFRNFTISILLVGLLSFIQFVLVAYGVEEALTRFGGPALEIDARGTIAFFIPVVYISGLIVITWLAVWNWSDLKRWFPRQ